MLLTIFLGICVWITLGLYQYVRIYTFSKELYEEEKELYLKESSMQEISKSVKFFLPRLELNTDYKELLDFQDEIKNHPFRHCFITIPKFMVLGPIFLFF